MSDLIWMIPAGLFLAGWARPVALTCRRALHILQLEEYQTVRFLRWLGNNRSVPVDAIPLTTGIVVAVIAWIMPAPLWAIVPLVGATVGAWQSLTQSVQLGKKPLVLTARARRLLVGQMACILLVLGILIAIASVLVPTAGQAAIVGLALGLTVVAVATWHLVALANLLLFPVEAGFRRYYTTSAKLILRSFNPTVVGVAGSYGKTSTKAILTRILETRFTTLATPRSFNTPMGLCRVIREQLRPTHQFFIAELGAYERGEIRELCRLVHPTIGVLTSVGPEHLERFGSMTNVVEGEAELIVALPAHGLAVVNGDDELCRQIARAAKCRYVFAGGPPDERRAVWADGVTLTSAGLTFTLRTADGRSLAAHTHLLGRHNINNILLATAAALECGIAFDDIAAAIERLEPVEHRLELMANNNGIAVIDDTYNSNPRGATAALETLASFQGGRRYLITPGMVELADYQDTAHREFGRLAAQVCDVVILIGPKRTKAIAEGLVEAGVTSDRLIVTANLAEATDRLREILRPGDAVLFENDLPDNYTD
jgi:UDP-N-acetylmuramoyl-tripeptide--D-alanyl-D-alanine ligase